MKARPIKLVYGEGYKPCSIEECTHVQLNVPGPTKTLFLPVILKGKRDGTNCWTWNGNTEKPTLRPSVLSTGTRYLGGEPTDKSQWVEYRCHSWINDGKAQFLDDCSHEYRNQTLDLLDVNDNV